MILRIFDIVLASIGLVVASPLLLLLCVAGLFDTGSPLFIQERVGRNRRPFRLVKFRTMRPGTPSVGTHLADAAAVTRWGAFLRRTKLDELPQLWNVLKGEMSLVGPRPCLPNQTELIEARQRLGVFSVRPGITGLAQVRGIDMSDPERLAKVDAEMALRLGLGLYLHCVYKTLTGNGFEDPIARGSQSPLTARNHPIPSPFHHPRAFLAFTHDVVAAAIAWMAAFWLRFSPDWPELFWTLMLDNLPWVTITQASVFLGFGLYRGIWRYASLPDLKRLLLAVAVAALASPAVVLLSHPGVVMPRSVLLLDPILLLLIMGGSRLAYRAWKERRIGALLHPEARPVLVLGAGSAADFLLRELARNPSSYRVVGLLDDDPAKIGRRIQDVPVLGPLRELEHWARRMEVGDVILAMPSAKHHLRKRLTEQCGSLGLNVLTVPSMEDLMAGRVSVSSLRRVELDDLLGRDPVELDSAGLHRLLTDRVVLVTGAGGSIGAELCRQIARFRPARLVMVEMGEFALYQIEQEFRVRHPDLDIACVIGDVKDALRMGEVMAAHRPAVVFHAAAYKHVPLMEENALQALKNNVLGTFVMARATRQAGVEKFVMVSTDKAVNPTNVMGASKRLAEMVCQVLRPQAEDAPGAAGLALAPAPPAAVGEATDGTRFVSVRFGNVLGSSGSVIPRFQAQIEAGGPVTVTHPEITRYFMSIPEAAQLVLQAGLMGQGGEIFVLDMGEPVRIADLARLMIKLAGRSEDEIRIVYTGLRPGEKLYEELLADEESTLPTPHPKLRVARARPADSRRMREILDWIAATPSASDAEVRARLAAWLPEYRPGEVASAPKVVPLDGPGRSQALGDGGGDAGLHAVGQVAGGVQAGH